MIILKGSVYFYDTVIKHYLITERPLKQRKFHYWIYICQLFKWYGYSNIRYLDPPTANIKIENKCQLHFYVSLKLMISPYISPFALMCTCFKTSLTYVLSRLAKINLSTLSIFLSQFILFDATCTSEPQLTHLGNFNHVKNV